MNKEEIAQRIERSPERERIENALTGLFGERDVRRIDDPSLEVFVMDVLPKLIPSWEQ